jgi:sugar phosphate isomerase/epimerase
MSLRDKIGFAAKRDSLEGALAWAVAKDCHYLEFNADREPNCLFSWNQDRVASVRDTCDRSEIHLGLHTLSAVNVAEFSPYLSEAIDEYHRGYIDLAVQLKCEWIIVHSGFYQGGAIEARMAAAVEHLKKAADYAEKRNVLLLLENHNREPKDAEMHYFTHNVEECRYYFDRLESSHLGWAFNIGHANLVPEGVDGFLDEFGIDRIGQVILCDNRGDVEGDLRPGEGTVDFASLFDRLFSLGFSGHYQLKFGTREAELEARDELVERYGQD